MDADEDGGERNGVNGTDGVAHPRVDREQAASESSRYECQACGSHFCIDCDLFCHEVLHNCPGCLSGVKATSANEGDGVELANGKVKGKEDSVVNGKGKDGANGHV